MEKLEVNGFSNIYRNRRVLLTGHSGFKGSWLSLWLQEMGAEVVGLALTPETDPSHWSLLGLSMETHEVDIRNFTAVREVVRRIQPEIVFHLAAQALVRRSYRDPLETWSTNVMGTANVLEACHEIDSVKAIVVVTTDKCYENREWEWGYRENDPLGGHDPYSASKAGAELVVASYRKAFFSQSSSPLLASARAGNVIGGGDWSEDRLIPDLIRAAGRNAPLHVRSPNATRPWQHVLESLSGYLCLGQKLLEGRDEYAQSWNFGPDTTGNRSVAEVLTSLKSYWSALEWTHVEGNHLHEATLLYLDSAKARQHLQWNPIWSLDQCLQITAEWYKTYSEVGTIISRAQLNAYVAEARSNSVHWALP